MRRSKKDPFIDFWGWAKFPLLVLYDSRLKPVDKIIYVYLVGYSGLYGYAFPSYKRICNELKISRNTLSKSLKRLEEIGLISIERREIGSSHYHFPELQDVYADEPDSMFLKSEIETSFRNRGMGSFVLRTEKENNQESKSGEITDINEWKKKDINKEAPGKNRPELGIDDVERYWIELAEKTWPDVKSLKANWSKKERTLAAGILDTYGQDLFIKAIEDVFHNWERYCHKYNLRDHAPSIFVFERYARTWFSEIEAGRNTQICRRSKKVKAKGEFTGKIKPGDESF